MELRGKLIEQDGKLVGDETTRIIEHLVCQAPHSCCRSRIRLDSIVLRPGERKLLGAQLPRKPFARWWSSDIEIHHPGGRDRALRQGGVSSRSLAVTR